MLREDLARTQVSNALTGQPLPAEAVPARSEGSALEQRLLLPDRVKAMCAHLFERLLATGAGDPLQKTIVYCASDHHADVVVNELNNLYHAWRQQAGRQRVPVYAFKCMASVGGKTLIPEFRSRKHSHLVATTMDLLTTGVDVPCVRNIVFFRYVRSAILFHQIVGRGTRIDEGSGKLMFRIFDYTGATALFGESFITPPPSSGGAGPPPPGPPPEPPTKATGLLTRVVDAGQFNLMTADGRLRVVTPGEYQQRLVEELTARAPTLAEFRARWLDPERRRELLNQLAQEGLVPGKVREAGHLEDYDEFDILAALTYGVTPLTRAERAARFGDGKPGWLVPLPRPTVQVIRKIVKQFERAGTAALDSDQLLHTLDEPDALASLSQGGQPSALLRKTKEDLFAA